MGKQGKNKKSGQFPPNRPASKQVQQTDRPSQPTQNIVLNQATQSAKSRIQPEKMSLLAHDHIQAYLQHYQASSSQLTKDEVTAVLRLRQHLRVFGLLSAVGFVNQSNQQEGRVSNLTNQVWQVLLNKLVDEDKVLSSPELMKAVQEIAQSRQSEYMVLWRRSLKLSHYWNFWAKAYQEEKNNDQREDLSNSSSINRAIGKTASRALPD